MAGKKLSEMKSFVDSYPHHRVHLGVDVHKLSYHVAVLRADGCTATMVLPADPMCVLKLIDNSARPSQRWPTRAVPLALASRALCRPPAIASNCRGG